VLNIICDVIAVLIASLQQKFLLSFGQIKKIVKYNMQVVTLLVTIVYGVVDLQVSNRGLMMHFC